MMEHAEGEPLNSLNGSPYPRNRPSSAFLYFVAFSIVLSNFMFGFHGGALNTPQNVISKCFLDYKTRPSADNEQEIRDFLGLIPCLPMSEGTWGVAVAMYPLGGLLGTLLGGFLMSRLGRKWALMATNALISCGCLLAAFSASVAAFILARILVGLGVGASLAVVTVYISEISPLSKRGRIGSLPQIFTSIGLVAASIVGIYFSFLLSWRKIFLLALGPSLLQTLLLLFCPESPEYLKLKQKKAQAIVSYKRLGITGFNLDGHLERASFLETIRNKRLRKSLELAILLQIIQQFTGVNAVVYYSTNIFAASLPNTAAYATIGLYSLLAIFAIFSAMLVDRLGRRPLLILSLSGVIICLSLMVIGSGINSSGLLISSTMAYMAIFSLGLGPIPWLMMGELFPVAYSSSAVSIGCCFNWIGGMLVGVTYPLLLQALSNLSFLPFASISLLSLSYCIKRVPETKGKEISVLLSELNE